MSARRSDEDYASRAVVQAIKVIEALEGNNFEPVSIKRVAERTKFSYDICFRTLRTLKLLRWAAETPDGWTLGPSAMRLGTNFNQFCIAALSDQGVKSSEISEL